jgi:PHD/YefM family antitoxin component YafN of YafNO toxin-antitoxin module
MYQVTVDYAKSHLDELCDRTGQEPQGIKISRGDQDFILLSKTDWEALVETTEWLQSPNIVDDVESARREYANNETLTMDQVFGS